MKKKTASNITSDEETGLKWSRDDWKTFLIEGSTPDDDHVGGEMFKVIKYGIHTLTESDINDVITYLMDLRPIKTKIEVKK